MGFNMPESLPTSVDELRALFAEADNAFKAVQADEDISTIERAERLDALDRARREIAAAGETARAAEIEAKKKIAELTGGDAEVIQFEANKAEDSPETEVETEVETEGNDSAGAEAEGFVLAPEAVAAAVELALQSGEFKLGGEAIVPDEVVTPAPPAAMVASVAGGQTGDISVGQEIQLMDLGHMLNDRMGGPVGNGVTSTRLASVHRHQDGVPKVTTDPVHNTKLLTELRSKRVDREDYAKTAALCGPPEFMRDIEQCCNPSRSVANLFRRVQSERGSFQWFDAVGMCDILESDCPPGEWTDADQDAVDPADPSTWKCCLTLDCPTDPSCATVNRIFHCLKIETLQQFSAPEQVEATIGALNCAHARLADSLLLQKIRDYSVQLTYPIADGSYGAIPRLCQAIKSVMASASHYCREDMGNYIAIIPQSLLIALGIDECATCDECSMDISDALGGMRVEVVKDYPFHLDPQIGGDGVPYVAPYADLDRPAPGGPPVAISESRYALPAGPWPILLIDPSDGFFFEMPRIEMGITRSPELARQNCAQLFVETFEGLGKQGCNPWYSIDIELCFNGSRAGTEVAACPTAAEVKEMVRVGTEKALAKAEFEGKELAEASAKF